MQQGETRASSAAPTSGTRNGAKRLLTNYGSKCIVKLGTGRGGETACANGDPCRCGRMFGLPRRLSDAAACRSAHESADVHKLPEVHLDDPPLLRVERPERRRSPLEEGAHPHVLLQRYLPRARRIEYLAQAPARCGENEMAVATAACHGASCGHALVAEKVPHRNGVLSSTNPAD